MIKITNGVEVFEVSKGAFESIYKNQGFNKVGEEIENEVETEIDEDFVDLEIDESGDEKEPEDKDENVNDDEAFCEALMEKPIGQWKKKEVKKFCKIMNIDISKTESPDEAKEIIKKFLDA